MTLRSTRRAFLKAGLAAAAAHSLEAESISTGSVNLVPTKPQASLSYWCTWGTQIAAKAEDDNATIARLNEKNLFDDPGWASRYYEKIRGDLFLVLDEGWDVDLSFENRTDHSKLGSLELAQDKFPSFLGKPNDRLRKLNEHVQQLGWAGTGLWIAAQLAGDGRPDAKGKRELRPQAEVEPYWVERARWCGEAGVRYWKVDWGERSGNLEFRKMLSHVARRYVPDLNVEHAALTGPVNTPDDGTGRYANWTEVKRTARETLAFSDVLRGYDILYQMPTATMLDRIATLLTLPLDHPEGKGYLNSEDEVYLGAALGCALGIMRHPLWAANTTLATNPVQYHRRINEAVRAVRWQRIAPPVPLTPHTATTLSTDLLTDHWFFTPGSTWMRGLIGKDFSQTAPACVARNMPLPTVHSKSDPPFVVCSRHPNGAIAVAALQRSLGDKIVSLPAHVTLEVGKGTNPVGVFGIFDSLILITDHSPLHHSRILAQDLVADEAVDITAACKREGKSLQIPGSVLARICLKTQGKDDLSLPGVVLKIS